MSYFACHYTYASDDPDIVRVRPEHRQFIGGLKDRGLLVASGPYNDGHGSALILIRLPEDSTVDDAYAVLDEDPYHRENVLAGREIRRWNPVISIFD